MRDLWGFYWPLIKEAPRMAVSSTDRAHSVGLIIAFVIASVLPAVTRPLAHWASIGWQASRLGGQPASLERFSYTVSPKRIVRRFSGRRRRLSETSKTQENQSLRTQIRELQAQRSGPPLTPLEKAQMEVVREKLEKVSEGAIAQTEQDATGYRIWSPNSH